ncbi:VlmB-like protein [Streptomyces sp. MNP-20]|uniref:VlmB-like protein n=1 Tax=Streptomyces sp. MNP-20 TaxID=2721165 RepID=UPI0015577D6C|nr:VlmB-like protein [Streptomyces sp. MNP-20]
MTTAAPSEVDLDSAPGVLEGACTIELTAEQCDLPYWLEHVAGGMLRTLREDDRYDLAPTRTLLAPGALREALVTEFSFRYLAEEKAARALGELVARAPDTASLEFFSTQLVDEARHARAFREHLLRLGIDGPDVAATIERVARADSEAILDPLERFALDVVRGEGDFYGGVVTLTVLVEGVLAPAAELSERKWRPWDPAAALVERAANIDEIRHLAVGSAIVRRHVADNPAERERLAELVATGRALWKGLPMVDMLLRRELLFQEGLSEHAALIGGYEVWPGRRLVDTDPQERLETAQRWSHETQQARLDYMLLADGSR